MSAPACQHKQLQYEKSIADKDVYRCLDCKNIFVLPAIPSQDMKLRCEIAGRQVTVKKCETSTHEFELIQIVHVVASRQNAAICLVWWTCFPLMAITYESLRCCFCADSQPRLCAQDHTCAHYACTKCGTLTKRIHGKNTQRSEVLERFRVVDS